MCKAVVSLIQVVSGCVTVSDGWVCGKCGHKSRFISGRVSRYEAGWPSSHPQIKATVNKRNGDITSSALLQSVFWPQFQSFYNACTC